MESTNMLKNKTAIIYGAGGAIGSAVAKAFAREGAHVFLTDLHLDPVQNLAELITSHDGRAEAAIVDVLDAKAVQEHLDNVVSKAGKVDISFNAMSLPQTGIQGTSLVQLSLDNFTRPIHAYMTGHFLTMSAAGRQMATQGSGVLLTITASPGETGAPLLGGMGPSWMGIESLTRDFALELGPQGVRAVTMRSSGLPETETLKTVVGQHAQTLGMTSEAYLEMMRQRTFLHRLPNLEETAEGAVFLASDMASAVSGTAVNFTC
ncbi:MAG TPA: SDR family oxidoreductase [Candidatus Chromulinivoraceae bacterium]|nr:SDR family oxidoreductase [Candidatus Chromulinivoraceae bacterium]